MLARRKRRWGGGGLYILILIPLFVLTLQFRRFTPQVLATFPLVPHVSLKLPNEGANKGEENAFYLLQAIRYRAIRYA